MVSRDNVAWLTYKISEYANAARLCVKKQKQDGLHKRKSCNCCMIHDVCCLKNFTYPNSLSQLNNRAWFFNVILDLKVHRWTFCRHNLAEYNRYNLCMSAKYMLFLSMFFYRLQAACCQSCDSAHLMKMRASSEKHIGRCTSSHNPPLPKTDALMKAYVPKCVSHCKICYRWG